MGSLADKLFSTSGLQERTVHNRHHSGCCQTRSLWHKNGDRTSEDRNCAVGHINAQDPTVPIGQQNEAGLIAGAII